MIKNKTKLLVLFILCTLGLQAQDYKSNANIRSGNKAMIAEDQETAIVEYNEALVINPNDDRARFNKALSLNKSEKKEEAVQLLKDLSESSDSKEIKAAAYYNLGLASFEEQELDESLENFKNCLRLTPNDQDAKYNYYLVKNAKQQQDEQEEQDQDQEKDGDKDEENKEENKEKKDKEDDQEGEEDKDSEKKDEESKEEEEKKDGEGEEEKEKEEQSEEEKEGKEGEQGEEGDEKEGTPAAAQKLSKEEAERILEALEQQEKEIQAKLMKKKPRKSKSKPDKDW